MTPKEKYIYAFLDGYFVKSKLEYNFKYFEQAKEMEKQQQYEFAIGFLIWYCIEALQNQKYLALHNL